MSHTKWEVLRKLHGDLPITVGGPEMVAYVQGYILAMEDMLRHIQDKPLRIETILMLERSLEEAENTLEALNK